MSNETPHKRSMEEEMLESPKRDFFTRWLWPNKDTIWGVAAYKIAIDCAEDMEKRIGELTASIRTASRSSVFVGIGLILTGSAAWFLFCLEVYKVFFMTR